MEAIDEERINDILRRARMAHLAHLARIDAEGWALIRWTLAHPLRLGGHGRGPRLVETVDARGVRTLSTQWGPGEVIEGPWK